MQNKLNTHHADLLQSQSSANETDNSKSHTPNTEILKREKYQGFLIVGNNEMGYMITLGKFKLAEPFASVEDAIQYINLKDWDLILIAATAIALQVKTEQPKLDQQ